MIRYILFPLPSRVSGLRKCLPLQYEIHSAAFNSCVLLMKILRYWFFLPILSFIIVSAGSGCRKDILYTQPGARLGFSSDTVQFDTVFTTVGSVTLPLKIFNKYNKTLQVSEIRLGGGGASQFRINVDGVSGTVFHDIEIPPFDSLYLFIEVTVNPGDAALPFVITDSITFLTNDNLQDVQLVAWGQNAHFHNGELVDVNSDWYNDLPHVIYNSILVDTGITLTIHEGCRIYVHGGSYFLVQGTLRVEGTKDSTVNFQGDRLEPDYRDVPGQWGGIYFLRGSLGNSIVFARIFNALEGISSGNRLDSEFTPDDIPAFLTDPPQIEIRNTMIHDCQNNGLVSINSIISAVNLLVYNTGESDLALLLGGNYDFNFCTLAGYGSAYLSHQTPVFVLSDSYDFGYSVESNDVIAGNFSNSVIYGSISEGNEMALIHADAAAGFNYLFDHCFIRTDSLGSSFNNSGCTLNTDPEFTDIGKSNYTPGGTSPLINSGYELPDAFVGDDILGAMRPYDATAPDIGCYETDQE